MNTKTPLFLRSVALISSIPKGKILTYSAVAKLIGAPGCARHVSYILSSSSQKYDLPWHRVLNSRGQISLPTNMYTRQKELLTSENIIFTRERIDLSTYLWNPTKKEVTSILKGIPKHIPLASR